MKNDPLLMRTDDEQENHKVNTKNKPETNGMIEPTNTRQDDNVRPTRNAQKTINYRNIVKGMNTKEMEKTTDGCTNKKLKNV